MLPAYPHVYPPDPHPLGNVSAPASCRTVVQTPHPRGSYLISNLLPLLVPHSMDGLSLLFAACMRAAATRLQLDRQVAVWSPGHRPQPSLARRRPSTASGGAEGTFPGEPQREGQVAAPGQPRCRGRLLDDHHAPHGCTPGRSRLSIGSGAPPCSLSTPQTSSRCPTAIV
jgi:hypothetical protein